MINLVSKLQHNTFEKGEFSEEKARTLEETIALIKSFPWDQERPLTSVELTGPSITIQDENINWLKVGLYFNGKFCLYYLDNDNHLYEYHAPNLDDAIHMVTDFFDKQLDLQKFEKHNFNFNNQADFITNSFVYRVKFWRVLMLMSLMLFVGFTTLLLNITLFRNGIASINNTAKLLFYIFIPIASIFFYVIFFRMISHAIRNQNNYLQISKGNPIFHFGYNENNIQTYDKEDIKEVVVYDTHGGGRNPNSIVVFEIYFKDETVLKFSNILIPNHDFQSKFSNDLIRRVKKSLFRML